MECEGHDYKTPTHLKISGFLSTLIPAVAIAIWLPNETNILLGILVILSVVVTMDVLHFRFIEKPYIKEWFTKHMEEHHMGK